MTAAELELEHSVELEVMMNGKKTTLLSAVEQIVGTTALLTPIQINGKVAHGQLALCRNACAAQKRTDAQKQSVEIHGLYHVVVSSRQVSALHRAKVVACGHKDNGDIFVQRAHGFGKFKAVNAGHHDVRNDQIEYLLIHGVVSVLRTRAMHGGIAVAPKECAKRFAQIGVVLYNKDCKHKISPFLGIYRYYSMQMLRFC